MLRDPHPHPLGLQPVIDSSNNLTLLYFQPSEPKIKSSRMLLLELTDGTHTVFGMEYQLIPALKVSTPPGTKVVDLIDMHLSRAGLLILCFR